AALGEQGRCRQSGQQREYYGCKTIEERLLEREVVEPEFKAFALEVQAQIVLADQTFLLEEVNARVEGADGDVGREGDGGAKEALADEDHAMGLRDVEAFLLLQADDGLAEGLHLRGWQALLRGRVHADMVEADLVADQSGLGRDLVER